jgi:hypothetical protein
MSPAAVGTMVLTLALGVAGCAGPTEPADSAGQGQPGPSMFVTTLVVRSARAGFWLQPGDTVTVRIGLAPDDSTASSGTVTYIGLPLWGSASSPVGTFETSYFTHPDLGDRLIGLFLGASVAAARLVVFIDPDPLGMAWAVTASGPAGENVTLAAGDATIGS